MNKYELTVLIKQCLDESHLGSDSSVELLEGIVTSEIRVRIKKSNGKTYEYLVEVLGGYEVEGK